MVWIRQVVFILDQPLLLEILISLAVIHITLVIFEFFHCFLFKDLVTALLFEFFGKGKGVFDTGNLVEVFGVWKA